MTTWLDQVIAVPLVGVQMRPRFRLMSRLSEIVGTYLDELQDDDDGPTRAQAAGPWTFTASFKDGYSLVVAPDNLTVRYGYEIESREEPGKFPTFEEILQLEYTQLLSRSVKIASGLLTRLEGSDVIRVGIVAAAKLDSTAVPPGVATLLERLSAPWGAGSLMKSDTTLLARLAEREQSVDRCHHTIRFDETDVKDDLDLNLDWQRVFSPPIPVDPAVGGVALEDLAEAAMTYFEGLGSGEVLS